MTLSSHKPDGGAGNLLFYSYAEENPSLPCWKFERDITERLCLFALPDSFDPEKLGKELDVIAAALPALLRIFERPIIRLKDTEELLPVEIVKKINRGTVRYSATHSRTWDGDPARGLKPRFLLTERFEDDFSIYENIVFARTVDLLCSYLTRNLSVLRFALYGGKYSYNVDLLGRAEHMNFFSAAGKLYTGYIRNFENRRGDIDKCLIRMKKMYGALASKADYPVYRINRGYPGKLSLKPSNILTHDRNYRVLPGLLFMLSQKEKEPPQKDIPTSREEKTDRFVFRVALAFFAARHFGFSCGGEEIIDLRSPDIRLTLGDFTLRIKAVPERGASAIVLSFSKDSEYDIALTDGEVEPLSDTGYTDNGRTVRISADPPSTGRGEKKEEEKTEPLFISQNDIDSFRRIQQLILCGMVYSDAKKEICPFCQRPLERELTGKGAQRHICLFCGTVIEKKTCPAFEKEYYETGIKGFRPSHSAITAPHPDNLSLYHFRSITPVDDKGRILCPICKKVHK